MDAIKQVARRRGLSKRDVYAQLASRSKCRCRSACSWRCSRLRLPRRTMSMQVVERARKDIRSPRHRGGHREGRQGRAAKGLRRAQAGRAGARSRRNRCSASRPTPRRSPRAALAMLVDEAQAPLGRPRHRPHARLPDVRPLRHARDDHPRPADASQRARPGRRRPDVLPATRLHAATRSSGACASSSRPPVSAAATRTTTCCISSPGSIIPAVTGKSWERFRARAHLRRRSA